MIKKHVLKNFKEKVLFVFNNAKYDIIDIHLYDDAENWHKYIDLLPKDKPIIVTEFEDQVQYLKKQTKNIRLKE